MVDNISGSHDGTRAKCIVIELVGKIGRRLLPDRSAGILPGKLVKVREVCGLEVRATSIFPTNSIAKHLRCNPTKWGNFRFFDWIAKNDNKGKCFATTDRMGRDYALFYDPGIARVEELFQIAFAEPFYRCLHLTGEQRIVSRLEYGSEDSNWHGIFRIAHS